MTAYEELKARYQREPLTDLETLVLTFGGEAEAQELARMQKALKKIANMKNYKLKQGETISEAFYKCHAMAQKALDNENQTGVQ